MFMKDLPVTFLTSQNFDICTEGMPGNGCLADLAALWALVGVECGMQKLVDACLCWLAGDLWPLDHEQ